MTEKYFVGANYREDYFLGFYLRNNNKVEENLSKESFIEKLIEELYNQKEPVTIKFDSNKEYESQEKKEIAEKAIEMLIMPLAEKIVEIYNKQFKK